MTFPDQSDAAHRATPDTAASRERPRWLSFVLRVATWAVVATLVALVGWATYRYIVNPFRIWPELFRLLVPQLKLMALCAAGMVALISGVGLLQLLASRWRTLQVFVTYQNAVAPLAAEVSGALTREGLDAQFIPFLERDHDALIEEVRRRLRRCDAVVAVPGETKSFIDAELLSASTLGKPIVIVKYQERQTLSDTLYRGYPAIDIHRLRERGFRPLARLLSFACNHRKDVPLNLFRVLSATGKALFAMVASVPFLLGVPRMVTDVLLVFNLGAQAIRVALWTYWAMFGVAMAGFVFGFAFMAFAKFRAIRTVKQDIITRGFTYAHLAGALGLLRSDRDILWCLEREPLPLRQ